MKTDNIHAKRKYRKHTSTKESRQIHKYKRKQTQIYKYKRKNTIYVQIQISKSDACLGRKADAK